MNLEPLNKLDGKNLDNVEDGETMDSKKRCALSKVSILENTDPTSKAFGITEVRTCIMEYLPVDDSINVRCVCKLWNEYYRPKFVFRDCVLGSDEVTALLLNSGCQSMKLEFQNYYVQHIPVHMWEECGWKIRFLHLHCCDFGMDTLQSIIFHCTALETLEICQNCNDFPSKISIIVQLLDYFIERKEQRTRLHTLIVKYYQPTKIRVSEFLMKTYTVFPRIVDLRCMFDGIYDDDEASYSATDENYDLRKLKNYTVFSESDYLWSENSVVPLLDYQLLRLKKFETKLHVEDFITDLTKRGRLFQFFTVQKDLEVVDLELKYHLKRIDEFEVFIKSIIFHVLKSCSKLREFQLIGEPGFIYIMELTGKEIKEFFSLISNLQSLRLSCSLRKDTSEKTVLPSSLPTLSLSVFRMVIREPYFFSVIKRCAQLKHLNINVNSDEQLRELIVALPDLETLVLKVYGTVTNYGFTGENEESSIRRLQRLEYLHINNSAKMITEEIFDEFCFPRLRYLRTNLFHGERVRKPLWNMPALKTYFNIYLTIKTVRGVTKLCKSLTNLNHLIIHRLADQDETLVVRIFNLLPKLKMISCCRDCTTFICNRISGEVHRSSTCNNKLEFFENEFFGKTERYH